MRKQTGTLLLAALAYAVSCLGGMSTTANASSCRTVGAFTGSFSGDASGSVDFLVRAGDGTVTGFANQRLQLTGSQKSEPAGISGSVGPKAGFLADVGTSGSLSGSWDAPNRSGAIMASRVGAIDDAVSRFTGEFSGAANGFLVFDVDATGAVTGAILGPSLALVDTLSGSVTDAELTLSSSRGAVLNGTVDAAADTFSGNWTLGGLSGPFSGTRCRLAEESDGGQSSDPSVSEPIGLTTDTTMDRSGLQIASVAGDNPPGVIATATHRAEDDLLVVTGERDAAGVATSVIDARLRVTDGEGTQRTGRFTFNDDGLPRTMTVDGVTVEFTDYTDSAMRVSVFGPDGAQIGETVTVALDPADLTRLRSNAAVVFRDLAFVAAVTSQSAVQPDQAATMTATMLNVASCAASVLVAKGFIATGVGAPVGAAVGAYAATACSSAVLSVGASIGSATDFAGGGALEGLSTTVDSTACALSGSADVFTCGAAASGIAGLRLNGPDPDADIAQPGDSTTVAPGQSLSFYGVGSIRYGDIDAFSWRFGDGATSDEDATMHAYSSPGTYEAVFKVIYEDGTAVTDQVTVNVENALSPPRIESVTSADGALEVDWTRVSGADGYNLYFSTMEGTADSGSVRRDVDPPYRLTGLQNSTEYFFVVRAVGPAGVESEASAERSGIPAVSGSGGVTAADFAGIWSGRAVYESDTPICDGEVGIGTFRITATSDRTARVTGTDGLSGTATIERGKLVADAPIRIADDDGTLTWEGVTLTLGPNGGTLSATVDRFTLSGGSITCSGRMSGETTRQ